MIPNALKQVLTSDEFFNSGKVQILGLSNKRGVSTVDFRVSWPQKSEVWKLKTRRLISSSLSEEVFDSVEVRESDFLIVESQVPKVALFLKNKTEDMIGCINALHDFFRLELGLKVKLEQYLNPRMNLGELLQTNHVKFGDFPNFIAIRVLEILTNFGTEAYVYKPHIRLMNVKSDSDLKLIKIAQNNFVVQGYEFEKVEPFRKRVITLLRRALQNLKSYKGTKN